MSALSHSPMDRDLYDAFVRHVDRAVELGFVGDPDPDLHLENARAFADALPQGTRVLDLGSGGGLPGIALLALRPDLDLTMLDAQRRRCELLRSTIDQWPTPANAIVVEGRAEDLARSDELADRFDSVVARLFGAPAVTAECAVRFLQPRSGILLVSEPPELDPERWSAEGLAQLGLIDQGLLGRSADHVPGRARIRVIGRRLDLPDRFPRPVGRPSKRPLF